MYCYRHINGEIIKTTNIVVDTFPGGADEYFNYSFVSEWWYEEDERLEEDEDE